jgi:hypothetical protein
VLEEGREALVEPRVRPVAAGHEVAEPLVRELVGDEVVGGGVEGGARVDEAALGERAGGGVLHAAEGEVVNRTWSYFAQGTARP